MADLPATPELDKQARILDTGENRIVSEFYDWLRDQQHLTLCRWVEDRTDRAPCLGDESRKRGCREGWATVHGKDIDDICRVCNGTGNATVPQDAGFVPDSRTPGQLIADFFGIDTIKVEAERRALLRHLASMPIEVDPARAGDLLGQPPAPGMNPA